MKIRHLMSALLLALLFASCLKTGMDDAEYFDDADITKFEFEYRWIGENDVHDRLFVQKLTTSCEISGNVITCNIEVPTASGDFTAEIRNEVSMANLVGSCELSNAATVEPINKAPQLGALQDFSGEKMQYRVTAANGETQKIWTLKIGDFLK